MDSLIFSTQTIMILRAKESRNNQNLLNPNTRDSTWNYMVGIPENNM